MQHMSGGRRWLAHPPCQDILTSEHHNLIKPDKAVVSDSENCKGISMQLKARQTSSQHAASCRNCRNEKK